MWTPLKRSSCPTDPSTFSSKFFFLHIFYGIQNLEMKTDEKFETKAAKRDKDMWKLRMDLHKPRKS